MSWFSGFTALEELANDMSNGFSLDQLQAQDDVDENEVLEQSSSTASATALSVPAKTFVKSAPEVEPVPVPVSISPTSTPEASTTVSLEPRIIAVDVNAESVQEAQALIDAQISSSISLEDDEADMPQWASPSKTPTKTEEDVDTNIEVEAEKDADDVGITGGEDLDDIDLMATAVTATVPPRASDLTDFSAVSSDLVADTSAQQRIDERRNLPRFGFGFGGADASTNIAINMRKDTNAVYLSDEEQKQEKVQNLEQKQHTEEECAPVAETSVVATSPGEANGSSEKQSQEATIPESLAAIIEPLSAVGEDMAFMRQELQTLRAAAMNWQKERAALEMQLVSVQHIDAQTTDRNASQPGTPNHTHQKSSDRNIDKDEDLVLIKAAAKETELIAHLTATETRLAAALQSQDAQKAAHAATTAQQKQEMSTQTAYFSTKINDVMALYNECKGKLKKAQASLDESAAGNKSLEDELAALRSKHADLRKTGLAAQETYSEEKIYSTSLIAQLNEEISASKVKLGEEQQRWAIERTSLSEAMAESFATQLQAAKTSADISLKECLKKMHMAEEAHETALQSLQVKVSDLQEQQKSREETETVHEDYKKRAQHALKKANAAAALRTLEIETLQKELEDTKAEMTSIQQHQATLSNSEAAATSTHEALLVRCQQFEDEKKSWEEEMRVLKAACEQAKASAASATATAAPGASAITAASDSPPQVAHPLPVPSLQYLDTLPQKKQKESPASSVQKQQQSPPTSPDDASRSPVLASANEVNSNASRRSTSPSASEGSRSEAGGLFYTSTLKTELQELRGMLSSRAVEIETLRRSLQSEKGQRVKLETQREELIAFIDRTKAASGGDSSVNMEYLKNCVMRFMATVELNEKKKLFPVIATILKLTASERDEVEGAFVQQERFALADGLSGTLNSVRSFWGGGK